MQSPNHKTQTVEEVKEQALKLMKQAGYEIPVLVSVSVDPDLQFMGYTTEKNGKPHIVVAKFALESGMAINLLVHELSHVYRIQTNHPSHDAEFLTAISSWVMQGKIIYDFQGQVLENILNHLQDLYADDISFKIFSKNTAQKDLNEFFLTWIHEHSTAQDVVQRSWENADNVLSAAFAGANLERHGIKDTDGKVAKAIDQFLEKSGTEKKEKFKFFKDFMVLLPEEVTKKQFEKLLIAYLSEFLKLTKIA